MNMMKHMNVIRRSYVPKIFLWLGSLFLVKNKIFSGKKRLVFGSFIYMKFIAADLFNKSINNYTFNEHDEDRCTRVYIADYSMLRHFLKNLRTWNEHAKFIQVH